jgi:hypothetical protein
MSKPSQQREPNLESEPFSTMVSEAVSEPRFEREPNYKSESIPPQATFTINKSLALMLAKFLHEHGYEFRRLYDQFAEIKRDPIYRSVPSLESRMVWIELIALLKGEEHG